jgi:hypothetical protein
MTGVFSRGPTTERSPLDAVQGRELATRMDQRVILQKDGS